MKPTGPFRPFLDTPTVLQVHSSSLASSFAYMDSLSRIAHHEVRAATKLLFMNRFSCKLHFVKWISDDFESFAVSIFREVAIIEGILL